MDPNLHQNWIFPQKFHLPYKTKLEGSIQRWNSTRIHTHNPKFAAAFLLPCTVSWLQRNQRQEPAAFSYHSDSRNLRKHSWGSRWRCPPKQQAYLCRWCRFPRSPAGRCSCVPGRCWCRWRFCHSCAVRCHSRHALQGGGEQETCLYKRNGWNSCRSALELTNKNSGDQPGMVNYSVDPSVWEGDWGKPGSQRNFLFGSTVFVLEKPWDLPCTDI